MTLIFTILLSQTRGWLADWHQPQWVIHLCCLRLFFSAFFFKSSLRRMLLCRRTSFQNATAESTNWRSKSRRNWASTSWRAASLPRCSEPQVSWRTSPSPGQTVRQSRLSLPNFRPSLHCLFSSNSRCSLCQNHFQGFLRLLPYLEIVAKPFLGTYSCSACPFKIPVSSPTSSTDLQQSYFPSPLRPHPQLFLPSYSSFFSWVFLCFLWPSLFWLRYYLASWCSWSGRQCLFCKPIRHLPFLTLIALSKFPGFLPFVIAYSEDLGSLKDGYEQCIGNSRCH